MELSYSELQTIYDILFNEVVKAGIEAFMSQNLDDPEFYYATEMLWKTDALIGGIGGYCMPAHPNKNPFPTGIERDLYRPLQYARSETQICDVRHFARHVVFYAGMHLEAACRLLLKEKCSFGNLRFYNTTLGKAVHKIEQLGIFEKDVIEALYNFVAIYNKSKHEINQDETRTRMFNAYDAVVAYFAARVLGLAILQKVGREESFERYKIETK